MTNKSNKVARVWRSAQLLIGFHRDQNGKKRDVAKLWSPKNATAGINPDPSEQEAFVLVKSAHDTEPRDVQIKLRQDQIVLRRDEGLGWEGIIADDLGLTVSINGMRIEIKADGSVVRASDDGTTYLEADGSVLKKTETVEAMMSGDGVELTRRTDTTIAAIRHDGVIAKARDIQQIPTD
ncbi:hypothetical protein KUV57_24595 [Epibacterium sp. DP7N7-1]|uniref:hypothetical protein n=1 Tax=Tritonibacter mobilis TaxID=379347 RepID=UPI000806B252|nr:hypothetical protein [Tritonibacter mobilis]MBW3245815.1 hypothetical protein [Epibacterium sp. DP7N7-1]NKX39057.1 hypothetical protein [Rhodobacteraceae bacterium R_SAG5]